MPEILSIIDVNNYGLQSIVAGSGGGQINLQSKEVTISENGTITIQADQGYDGLSDVDVTVSGILDTSDATATASDMASGVTAYVNGQKVTGNVSTGNIELFDNYHAPITVGLINDGGQMRFRAIAPNVDLPNQMWTRNKQIIMRISFYKVANAINLQPEQIKKDEVVLGVTGTYEGTKAVLPDGIRFQSSITSNMDFLNNVDSSNITNMSRMFYGCTNLTTIPLLDTSNATDMDRMFYGCINLTTIPLLDTSNVTYMGQMFDGCTNLTTIPLLDTSNVTNMTSMFNGCTNLTTIPLLNTSTVTTMGQVFRNCTNLTTIPLLNTSNVTSMTNMFSNCSLLSNESLNNILAMCANTTSAYTGTKKLMILGLSQTQATTCQTLSNWDAFVAAGWSSGYTS